MSDQDEAAERAAAGARGDAAALREYIERLARHDACTSEAGPKWRMAQQERQALRLKYVSLAEQQAEPQAGA